MEETDEEGKTETRNVPDNVKVVVPIDEEYLEAQIGRDDHGMPWLDVKDTTTGYRYRILRLPLKKQTPIT